MFAFIPAQCPELLPIQNGRITYTGDSDNMAEYDIGTVATYECDTGFILVGSMIRDCVQVDNDTAMFNREAPVCGRKICFDCTLLIPKSLDYIRVHMICVKVDLRKITSFPH